MEYMSLPVREFCRLSGMGETLVRQMIADGRLRAVRVGKKKLLVDVESWREYMRKQALEGTPEYDRTRPAVEARQTKRSAKKATWKAAAKADADLVDLGLV